MTFRDPNNFVAGQLHRSLGNWDAVLTESQPTKRSEVWNWIENKVSIFPYFSHFKGSYKGTNYDSDRPPSKIFQNNVSCKPFATFIRETLLARLQTGAISLVGKVGQATPPFLELPLTVEPSKPRLCHDARFLNLWMLDKLFSLDRIVDAPWYVTKHSYQTVLDDKSGYDHVLLSEESRTYFGIQWGDGTSCTTHFRLDGRSPPMYATLLGFLCRAICALLAYRASCTSMIDTMASFKSTLTKENMLALGRSKRRILQRQNRRSFWLPFISSALAISLGC